MLLAKSSSLFKFLLSERMKSKHTMGRLLLNTPQCSEAAPLLPRTKMDKYIFCLFACSGETPIEGKGREGDKNVRAFSFVYYFVISGKEKGRGEKGKKYGEI